MKFRHLTTQEQPKLYPLLGKCFDCWKSCVKSTGKFPLEIDSFAAEEKGNFVAHCGVVRFFVSDGMGKRTALGGLASVCTDPGFRHLGLAETLCRMAISFGKEQHVAGLPLFTSFQRVYEKNSWRHYPIFMPKKAVWKKPGEGKPFVEGKKLASTQKQKIVTLYRDGFDFPGKVFRIEEDDRFSNFSWRRRFDKFGFSFGNGFYAAGGGNLVCELNGDAASREADDFLDTLPRENGATIFALPETSPFWKKIGERAVLQEADIFFHGPMVLDLDDREFFRRHTDVYFPLADRF